MSDTSPSRFSAESTRADKSSIKKCFSWFVRQFSLNGHLSYAFIYGSWEIVRARKVGTTHTKVDYVVYRLFYPVILIGVGLFAVVVERDLGKFFCLIEVWSMVLHIIYAFVFLQNVLANNLHRDNVKHRQKIPERLVVTDEIEKGGHKFYICKRFSILPTEKLYYTERFIWLIFNILATINVIEMVGYLTGQIQLEYKKHDSFENIRACSMGLLILADVFLTPIPMHFAHVVFPILYFSIYQVILTWLIYRKNIVLYKAFDTRNASNLELVQRYFAKVVLAMVVHSILMGFAALRDYIISSLDDSRTAQQLQNLRSQKRLARRKLMNYVEGPDGRIIGISLEKHSYVPERDEFIKTEKDQHRRRRGYMGDNDDDSTDELEEIKAPPIDGGGDNDTTTVVESQKPKGLPKDRLQDSNIVPLTSEILPPPKPRYHVTTDKDEDKFSSSSSSSLGDDMEALRKSIKKLPSAPKSGYGYGDAKVKKSTQPSRIPVPVHVHTFGFLLKPRDSKENIHQKMDHLDDSPPTPPFVKLVQTLIKVNKQAKAENEQEQQRRMKFQGMEGDGRAIHTKSGSALIKVVRVSRPQEEKRYLLKPRAAMSSKSRGSHKRFVVNAKKKKRGKGSKKADAIIDKLIKDAIVTRKPEIMKEEIPAAKTTSAATGKPEGEINKPVASRVVHLKSSNLIDEGRVGGSSEFNQQLADKLQKEKDKRDGIPEKVEAGKSEVIDQKQQPLQKKKKLKGILRRKDFGGGGGERLPGAKLKRREDRLMRRREERAALGKHGKAVYDPIAIPENIEGAVTTTSFHYLGTKLKGEKSTKMTVPHEDLPLYTRHPGIGTVDDGQVEDEEGKPLVVPLKSVVAFHPIVKYFDVNEVDKEEPKKKKPIRWA